MRLDILFKLHKFLGNETSNSSSFVDITNLTATLTPAAATSKFLITFNVSANANANQRGGIKVVRKIGSGSFSDFDLPDFVWFFRWCYYLARK